MVPCDGVVLAGGASRRMGQSKAELLTGSGQTLLDRAVSVLQRAIAGTVWISRPYSYSAVSARDLVDDRPSAGPLVGIAQALQASQYALVAVLAVDLPLVPDSLFTQMYERWSTHCGLAVVYPQSGSISQPLAALWHRRALPTIEEALKNDRPWPVQKVVSRLSSEHIEVPLDILTNINTPHDWTRFRDAGVAP
ncbi:MAG: molybdopterin-guanine dinucleotide biosynthesis protein MobA [Sulfobacillus acidophilus]|uniref:Probable molybdenum cofactor guanylyltransferase n=1 Tax=Sulfobacillus acidophilus TaxID=53633 RepID=A0A2T2WI40_9FIRM|nr:MAG: molybdopterin-guanine dinucleotide biosynthesis protein MobA [Sulfobacillus acidophilus]